MSDVYPMPEAYFFVGVKLKITKNSILTQLITIILDVKLEGVYI